MTASIATYDLVRAAALAGDGGTVSRSGIDYTVVYESGLYRLRQFETSRPQPLSDFRQDGWTVGGDSAAPTPTVQAYFLALAAGTHVRREGSHDTYVWSGRTAGDNRAPVLFSLEYGSEMMLDLPERDNTWAAVRNDDGPVVADALTIHLMSRVRSLTIQTAGYEENAAKMRADWTFLNERLNEYADEQRMCPDYERRLDTWNEGLQLHQLEGRKRDYTVRVAVEATYYIDVTVRASSEDAAHDQISDMSTYDVMDNGSWSSPDSLDHEISN